MPKIVDHEERRKELIGATWRVICRVGLHNTTVGLIAAEAGYSHGIVAHYFSSKADVLHAAHQLTFSRLKEKVDELLSDAQNEPAAAKLRTIFDWMLPLDDERRTEAEVELNFWGQAVTTDDLLAARTGVLETEMAEWWMPLIAGCRSDGLLIHDGSDESIAKLLMAFIDGVSAYSVLFPQYYGFDAVRDLGVEFLSGIISPVPPPLIEAYPFQP
ncbi:TetR/AcrR family transcriptional regulator [Mycolicibacterium mengxianglii]|uniref:TetR/AcrR family transcriptional regulator n=1 Tax=Mycolicibacterium mengxianglii TaxID=2736649 RepID=UPI0018EED3AC|nr:TetR/AcrR family transcriptional regulator [Mycolicibacterium mengxianglii]